MPAGTRPPVPAIALMLALIFGMPSHSAFAQLVKQITGIPGQAVPAVTTWYFLNCTTSLAVGGYSVDVAPQYGTLSYTDVSGPIPGCPTGSPSLPAAQALYTLTAFPSGVTSDYFQLTYSVNGLTEVDDITVVAAQPVMPAQILFNNTNIVGTTQDVYTGQQIPLTVSLPPGASPAGDNPWTVDGSIVGGFITSPAGQQPTVGLTNDVTYSQSSVTFYWIGPGEFSVRYSYVVDGQPLSVSAAFNVTGPGNPTVLTKASTSALVGSPQGSRNLYLIYLLNNSSGISFTASSTLPPNNPGEYQWVQLIVGETEVHKKFNGQSNNCSVPNVFPALDNVYPYNDLPDQTTVFDSPSIRILPDDKNVLFSFAADMYLMWNPLLPQGCYPSGQCTSIPVPLGYTSWQVTMDASLAKRGATWKASLSQGGASPFNPLIAYPEWNAAISNGIAVSCP